MRDLLAPEICRALAAKYPAEFNHREDEEYHWYEHPDGKWYTDRPDSFRGQRVWCPTAGDLADILERHSDWFGCIEIHNCSGAYWSVGDHSGRTLVDALARFMLATVL